MIKKTESIRRGKPDQDDSSSVMRGFPPPDKQRVTLNNWRTVPYSHWAFRNIRQLLPTALVRCGASVPFDPPSSALDVNGLSFEGIDGKEVCLKDFLQESHTHGFAVLHDNQVVFEHYAHGLRPECAHILFSVTKSVTATLAGILAERGVIDLDAPISQYVPEVSGSAYADAFLRHLLDMTVGIEFDEDYENQTGDFARYRVATGWRPATDPSDVDNLRDFLPNLNKQGEHGRSFHYVSPNTDLLGWIIERATGQAYADVLSQRLWQPMGALEDAYINVDRYSAPRAAGGLCVTLHDLLRFGQLHLPLDAGGKSDIVPAWWLHDLRNNGDQAVWDRGNFSEFMPGWRYRNQWYVSPEGAYSGLGVFGQYLYVDPHCGMVIAKLSAQRRALDERLNAATYRAFAALGHRLNRS